MKLYMWEEIEKVSDNYHAGGGLVVIARNEAHVRELIAQHNSEAKDIWRRTPLPEPPIQLSEDEWAIVKVFELTGNAGAEVIVFPNAGCC